MKETKIGELVYVRDRSKDKNIATGERVSREESSEIAYALRGSLTIVEAEQFVKDLEEAIRKASDIQANYGSEELLLKIKHYGH